MCLRVFHNPSLEIRICMEDLSRAFVFCLSRNSFPTMSTVRPFQEPGVTHVGSSEAHLGDSLGTTIGALRIITRVCKAHGQRRQRPRLTCKSSQACIGGVHICAMARLRNINCRLRCVCWLCTATPSRCCRSRFQGLQGERSGTSRLSMQPVECFCHAVPLGCV